MGSAKREKVKMKYYDEEVLCIHEPACLSRKTGDSGGGEKCVGEKTGRE